jgi:hypothetical protein
MFMKLDKTELYRGIQNDLNLRGISFRLPVHDVYGLSNFWVIHYKYVVVKS